MPAHNPHCPDLSIMPAFPPKPPVARAVACIIHQLEGSLHTFEVHQNRSPKRPSEEIKISDVSVCGAFWHVPVTVYIFAHWSAT